MSNLGGYLATCQIKCLLKLKSGLHEIKHKLNSTLFTSNIFQNLKSLWNIQRSGYSLDASSINWVLSRYSNLTIGSEIWAYTLSKHEISART